MARILHVDVQDLVGRPWQFAPNGDPLIDGLEDVRQSFTRYDGLVGVAPAPAPALPELRASVAAAHRTYQAARYQDVIAGIPKLLSAVDSLDRQPSVVEKQEVRLSYVSAYVVAAKILTKVGATDLALLAADRSATAAAQTDSLVARGMAAYQVSCALLRDDRPKEAEHLAVQMAEVLQQGARSDAPSVVSLAGALWLIAAVIAARNTDRGTAWQRLDQAQVLADLLDEDANHAWTAFGPTNVVLHRVSVAAELGDPGEALRVAADVDPDRLPKGLASRRAQMHLDLAWAQSQRKRDAEATLHLLEAERRAPEVVRYNVLVREMVREMMARSGRSQTSALNDLAGRSGVLA